MNNFNNSNLIIVTLGRIVDQQMALNRHSSSISIISNDIYTGWPKKVSHCQVSSLNRIKTVIKAKFYINFDYKMRKTM